MRGKTGTLGIVTGISEERDYFEERDANGYVVDIMPVGIVRTQLDVEMEFSSGQSLTFKVDVPPEVANAIYNNLRSPVTKKTLEEVATQRRSKRKSKR